MWLIIATIVVAALIYKLFLSGPGNIWKKYGIPEIDTTPAVTKMDVYWRGKSPWVADDYAYSQMIKSDLKFCGYTGVDLPVIVLRDFDLMRKVLIKDFDHFIDRRPFFQEADGICKKMMQSLEGDKWKGVRSAVSPTFTTGKIRRMMDSLNLVGKEWVEEFTHKANQNSGSVTIDVVNTVNQYTVQVISTAVFGMHADVIKNPNSTFAQMANRLTNMDWKALLKVTVRMNIPWLSRLLQLSFTDIEAIQYFENILKSGLQSRMADPSQKRDDYLQLLVEAKKGEVKAVGADELSTFEKEALITGQSQSKNQYLTEEILTAQSVVFFFAGFATTSNLITFTLYALAVHPEVQDRLRKEVGKIIKEDGSVDYDDVASLVYMDMVICEVLRQYSAQLRLERLCTREYRDPETGLVVPKGTLVAIPTNAIHHDKQYYDNPDKFDPEHFSPEKKKARSPYAFLPFGTGPRGCIGMRFALVESKSAVAHVIHNFIVGPTDKTPVPLQGKIGGFNIFPPPGLELKLTPIKKQ